MFDSHFLYAMNYFFFYFLQYVAANAAKKILFDFAKNILRKNREWNLLLIYSEDFFSQRI